MREIESIWSREFALTASHSFRNNLNQKPATPDVSRIYHGPLRGGTVAGGAPLVVHRRFSLGGDNDEWDGDRAWSALGGEGMDPIVVHRGLRSTLHHLDKALARKKIRPKTQYVYCEYPAHPPYIYGTTPLNRGFVQQVSMGIHIQALVKATSRPSLSSMPPKRGQERSASYHGPGASRRSVVRKHPTRLSEWLSRIRAAAIVVSGDSSIRQKGKTNVK